MYGAERNKIVGVFDIEGGDVSCVECFSGWDRVRRRARFGLAEFLGAYHEFYSAIYENDSKWEDPEGLSCDSCGAQILDAYCSKCGKVLDSEDFPESGELYCLTEKGEIVCKECGGYAKRVVAELQKLEDWNRRMEAAQ